MWIIYLLIFCLIGCLIFSLFIIRNLLIMNNLLKKQNNSLVAEKIQNNEKNNALSKDLSIAQYKQTQAEQMLSQMKEQFKTIATETVSQQTYHFIKLMEDFTSRINTNNNDFSKNNKDSMNEFIDEIEKKISNISNLIDQFQSKYSEEKQDICSQLSQVANNSHDLQREVSKVFSSLRSPNVKGVWGEMQLKKTVQLAGMSEYCDFEWQPAIGNGQKPDMVISLPNDKKIIVDSKVSLSAYINGVDTNDDRKKRVFMQEHAKQIKQHITILYNKKYWKTIDHSANFVILFLPGECFLSSALEANPSLLEWSSKHNVIIATPITMIALLKTIAYGWENIHISKDIEKIKTVIGNLFITLDKVWKDMWSMGKQINSAYNAYNSMELTVKNSVLPLIDQLKISDFGNNKKIDELDLNGTNINNNKSEKDTNIEDKNENMTGFDNFIKIEEDFNYSNREFLNELHEITSEQEGENNENTQEDEGLEILNMHDEKNKIADDKTMEQEELENLNKVQENNTNQNEKLVNRKENNNQETNIPMNRKEKNNKVPSSILFDNSFGEQIDEIFKKTNEF